MKEQDAAHSFKHDENECVFYLDNESVVFGCECGNIEIGGKTYYPEEKLTRLRSELQQKDEVIRKMLPLAHRAKSGLWANDPYCGYVDETVETAKELLKKQS